MNVFLQVLGVLFLLLLLAGVGLILFLRWQFKKIAKQIASMGGPTVPMTLDLMPADAEEWEHRQKADAADLDFKRAGFEPAGIFSSGRVPGLTVAGYVHQELRLYGGYFEMEDENTWFDLAQVYPDESSLTVTDQTRGADQPSPPWSEKVVVSKAGLAEVLSEMKKRSRPDAVEVDAGSFAKVLSDLYKKSMKWQVENGFINDPSTISDLEGFSGRSAHEGDMEAIRQVLEAKEAEMREAYLAAKGFTAAEWDRRKERTVFVHDGLNLEDLAQRLDEGLEQFVDGSLEPDSWEDIVESELTPREAWSEAIEELDLTEVLLFDLTVEEPYPCDVYCWQSRE